MRDAREPNLPTMSCCCKKVYKICDVVVCDDQDLRLPIPIASEGEYRLELDFLDDLIRINATQAVGDVAIFPKEGLNETFTYVGHVVAPDGTTVTFTIDEVEYDCVEFTTKRAAPWTNSSSSVS